MYHEEKIVDRQVGRNAQLFAETVAGLSDADARRPYVRILVSLLEQAHPELVHAQDKPAKIAHVLHRMSQGKLGEDEVTVAVRTRDEERGVAA